MKSKITLLLMTLFIATGCNSLKQRCQETNWFEYGKTLGLSGKYPDEDLFYGQCKKEGYEVSYSQLDVGFKAGRDFYCTQEGANKTGRDGHHFNFTMCEGGVSKSLLEKSYRLGLIEYCKPANGFEVGRQGRIYEKVCSQKEEVTFLPEYKKGRRIWLTAKVEERRSRSAELQREISTEQSSLHMAQNNLSYAQGRLNTFKAMNPAAPTDDNLSREVSTYQSSVSNYESNIRHKRDQLSKVEDEIRAYELERKTLEN
jgi:hypothetical protein